MRLETNGKLNSPPVTDTGTTLDHGDKPQSGSSTLLEALAKAIDGSDKEEAVRLAAEFNNAFGHLVRASVEAESTQGDYGGNLLVPDTPVVCKQNNQMAAKTAAKKGREKESIEMIAGEDDTARGRVEGVRETKRGKDPAVSSSDDSDVKKPKKKKEKKATSKKQP